MQAEAWPPWVWLTCLHIWSDFLCCSTPAGFAAYLLQRRARPSCTLPLITPTPVCHSCYWKQLGDNTVAHFSQWVLELEKAIFEQTRTHPESATPPRAPICGHRHGLCAGVVAHRATSYKTDQLFAAEPSSSREHCSFQWHGGSECKAWNRQRRGKRDFGACVAFRRHVTCYD